MSAPRTLGVQTLTNPQNLWGNLPFPVRASTPPILEGVIEASPFKPSGAVLSPLQSDRLISKVKSQKGLDGDVVNLIKEERD